MSSFLSSPSIFAPLGEAGREEGHFSDGALYRLAFDGECYEFELRVGQTAFGNYEPGTIEEFAIEDRRAKEDKIREILAGIILSESKEKVVFPSP